MTAPDATHGVVAADVLVNWRDIGGYAAANGKVVRRRLVYRSAEPVGLSAARAAALQRELALRRVLDLRTDRERADRPSSLAQAGVPTEGISMSVASNPRLLRGVHTADDLAEVLWLLASERTAELLRVLEFLGDADGFPTLMHCVAGKDRTGLVVGILLRLLGVSVADTARDYAASNASFEHLRQILRAQPDTSGVSDEAVRAPESVMRSTLERVAVEFGDVAGLLRDAGMDPGLPGRLRALMLAER